MLDSSFALLEAAPLCSTSPPSFARQNFPRCFSLRLFQSPSFPILVLALYFVLATWVQPSHPASPRPSSVSGANLVLTHRLLSFLPLSAAVLYCTVLLYYTVRQFLCHGRWYEQPDLWIQLAVHRRCHWLCRYDHSTPGLLTVSSVTSTVWVHPGREAAGVENAEKTMRRKPCAEIVQERVKVCTTEMSSRKLYAQHSVTKNLHISPRFSPTIFYRDVNPVLLLAHLCTAVLIGSMRRTLCSKFSVRKA